MSIDFDNHKAKCRFCFRRTGTKRKSVIINEEIQDKFWSYTNFELVMSNNYSISVCKQCLTTLNKHIKHKEKLITSQKKLYSHVDSQSFANIIVKEEPIEVNETSLDFNFVELSDVKTENDEENLKGDVLENEFELKVETRTVEEKKQKSTKRQIKNYSEDQIQNVVYRRTSRQPTFSAAVNPEIIKKARKRRRKSCKYCSKLVLKHHIRRHERLHENKFNNIFLQCDQCSYKTHVKLNLLRHIKAHFKCQDVSEFVCYFCAKVFTSVSDRYLHERGHTEQQGVFSCDFPCTECDQVFNRKWKLLIHKASHRPANVVPCEVCGKLVKKRSFYSHIKYHGPRDIPCSFEGCTKMFCTKTEVFLHKRSNHDESKNMKCPECAGVFPNEARLRDHIRRVHAAPSFFCEVEGCNYKQTRKERLKLHLRNHRDIETRLRDELLKKLEVRSYSRFQFKSENK